MTYNDISVGLPNLLLSLEMPLFSFFILYAYRTTPYNSPKMGKEFSGGPLGIKALFQALNMTDILSAFVRGPMRLVRSQEGMLNHDDSINLISNPPSYQSGVRINPGYYQNVRMNPDWERNSA